MPRYVIVGCLTIDHIIRGSGGEPVIQIGGDGYYGAAGARIWSGDVGIASVIPSTYPREFIDRLADSGIDTSGIVRMNHKKGFEGTIEYRDDGSRVLGAATGVFKFLQDYLPWLLSLAAGPYWEKVSPQAELVPESYLDARGVFLASMAYRNQAACLERFHRRAGTVVIDPPPLMPWVKHGTVPVGLADLSLADYVLPSEQETCEYWGDGISPDEAAERYFGLGASCVVLKMGEKGARVYERRTGSPREIPVFRTKAVDVTGAGDSFGGGFMVGIAETGDPVKAACYGAVSASFVVEGFGADHTLKVSRQDAEERLAKIMNG